MKDYYGMLDENFNQKILDFKNKYEISIDESNTVLVATNSSFEIGADPKCCLLFYRINLEYFCLIHQWGEEISFSKIINSQFFKSDRTYEIGFTASLIIFLISALLSSFNSIFNQPIAFSSMMQYISVISLFLMTFFYKIK